ncbi:MAG: hypothetical protein Kow00109_16370 [Acidobacteriota bacterium]
MRWRHALTALVLTGCAACITPLSSWRPDIRYAETVRDGGTGTEQSLSVRLDMKVGELTVEPGAEGRAFVAHFRYNETALEPEVRFNVGDEGAAELYLGLRGSADSFHAWGDNAIHLELNPRIPVALHTETGVGEAKLDLTGLPVLRLELESGVGGTEVLALEPNPASCERIEITGGVGSLEITGLGNLNCREFRLRGGVGGTKIDLSGDWRQPAHAEIEVGVGGVEIDLPHDLPVIIEAKGSMFSEVSMPSEFERRGNRYFSPAARDKPEHELLHIHIAAGIGGTQVRWR